MSAFDKDFTEDGWDAGELGIWYGAWTPDHLKSAASADDLTNLDKQKELGWNVTPAYFGTSIRFRNIAENDWVLVYLKTRRCLGLAQLASPLLSSDLHSLNRNGEVFKFRKITNKKLFRIDELPDAFQLLPAQGRSNVYELHSMQQHVALLVKFDTSEAIFAHLKTLDLPELLDVLGSASWESFCLAYLAATEDFVLTGLSAGRTLAVFDLVGRNRSTEARVYAQCKKDSRPVEIEAEFLHAAEVARDVKLYFFAFSGVVTTPPNSVRVFTKEDAIKWAATGPGRRYIELLLS
jgi:hypothetical protein